MRFEYLFKMKSIASHVVFTVACLCSKKLSQMCSEKIGYNMYSMITLALINVI